MKITVGVDIGGTNTAIGIVKENGEVIIKNSITTATHGNAEKFIKELSDAIKALIAKANVTITGIGVGAPNANYYKGTIEQAANLSFKGIIPFVDILKTHFPDIKHIALTNDANAATIGEMIYGGAKGMKNFVMYTLGTGVGSGIVVNGDLVYGHDGFAGECGHMMLFKGGRSCGCGVPGHLETYASAPGMKRTAFELMAKHNASDSLLANDSFNSLDSKKIYNAAISGDKIALEVFELTGDYLAQAIADTIHHVRPEAVFLFGGPTAAGNLIFNPIKEKLDTYLLPVFKGKIKVLQSELDMGNAAILGASALAFKEMVSQP